MAEMRLVKNKWDFLVSCRSKREQQFLKGKVLAAKMAWKKQRRGIFKIDRIFSNS